MLSHQAQVTLNGSTLHGHEVRLHNTTDVAVTVMPRSVGDVLVGSHSLENHPGVKVAVRREVRHFHSNGGGQLLVAQLDYDGFYDFHESLS